MSHLKCTEAVLLTQIFKNPTLKYTTTNREKTLFEIVEVGHICDF